ncbi:MAG: DUF3387 domain-containing protein [Methylococcales bacterium]|jgi:type I restriction enzyme, R subunit|nr:DUF3387 domain-containing protein [Methylococcales bacterium]
MAYTEDALVEQPTIQLFNDLGWQSINCFEEVFGEDGTLGRENRGEVILVRSLSKALKNINPDLTELVITQAIEELARDRSAMTSIAANEQVYQLICDGIKVTNNENGEEEIITVQVIDWNHSTNNEFLLCSQLFITGEIETRRPDLTEEQESRLEKEFARAYHIITREERLDSIAHDIVEHFMGREYMGKAMVLAIDKATAIRYYNKLKIEWQKKLSNLKKQLVESHGSDQYRLKTQIALMESTDMAVVVSGGQGEYEAMNKKGLDIRVHRERMLKEKLDEKFKDPDDPLRIVCVCAMWLTGFDAPSISTLYLDKPLKNHSLMQAIARANRVFPNKTCGQVVDYINIFGALQQALGMYGSSVAEEPGQYQVDRPANDKKSLLDALENAMSDVKVFLATLKISLQMIIDTPEKGFAKLELLDKATESLLLPKNHDEFVSYVRQINRIFKSILPDCRADKFVKDRVTLNVLYYQMRVKSGLEVDDQDVLDVVRNQVNELLDDAIETIQIGSNLPEPINISGIDFDALAEMIERIKKPRASDTERLKNIIARKLKPMLDRNKTRQNLQDKFQKLIEQYNLGAYTAEQFFEELKQFISELEDEEKRFVREGITEEELAIFDLLNSEVVLSEAEKTQVKTIAKELLTRLKSILVIDWKKKQRTKARVKSAIDEVLDNLPDVYDDGLWTKTSDDVYMHIFDKYSDQSISCYG